MERVWSATKRSGVFHLTRLSISSASEHILNVLFATRLEHQLEYYALINYGNVWESWYNHTAVLFAIFSGWLIAVDSPWIADICAQRAHHGYLQHNVHQLISQINCMLQRYINDNKTQYDLQKCIYHLPFTIFCGLVGLMAFLCFCAFQACRCVGQLCTKYMRHICRPILHIWSNFAHFCIQTKTTKSTYLSGKILL